LSSVADVGYIAIVVAGFGAYWWRHVRPMWSRKRPALAPDADVAVHVAVHEATSRHQPLSSLHVLYGLLQDEAVIAAIQTVGGDPDALEDRVLDALGGSPAPSMPDRSDRDAGPPGRPGMFDDGQWLLGRAAAIARGGGRQVHCLDLWAQLGDSPAGQLLDRGRLDRGAILFVLFHGGPAPEIPAGDHRDVFVVLRNDHYTTQEFVCSVLQDVFALSDEQARTMMMTTHTAGRAVIGRFAAAEARTKIAEVRARARARAFPLWLGVEPA
jgi:ATP-dependent Clp protease adaptor protein ClpS